MNPRHLLPIVLVAAGCRAPTPTFDPFSVYGSKRIPPPATGTVGPGDTYYQPSNPNTPGTFQPAPELPASPPPSLDSGGIPGNQTSSWESRDEDNSPAETMTVSAEEELSNDDLVEATNLVWNNPEPGSAAKSSFGNSLRVAENSIAASQAASSPRDSTVGNRRSSSSNTSANARDDDLAEITDLPPVRRPRPFRPFTVRGQTPNSSTGELRTTTSSQPTLPSRANSTRVPQNQLGKESATSNGSQGVPTPASELQWRKPDEPSPNK